jgi:predicted signal transduction protein with EAL and GGDEF domain
VVAEGIEEEACLAELCRLKCDSAQGFLMSRPLPVEALEAWLVDSPWGRATVTADLAGTPLRANPVGPADAAVTAGAADIVDAGRTLMV